MGGSRIDLEHLTDVLRCRVCGSAYAISDVLYQQFKDPIYSAPNLMKQMVQAGHFGRKTGKGFYDYGEK